MLQEFENVLIIMVAAHTSYCIALCMLIKDSFMRFKKYLYCSGNYPISELKSWIYHLNILLTASFGSDLEPLFISVNNQAVGNTNLEDMSLSITSSIVAEIEKIFHLQDSMH